MDAGRKILIKGVAAASTLAIHLAACGGASSGGATTTAGDTTTVAADTTAAPEATTTTESTTTTTVAATTTTVVSEEVYQTPEELGVEIGKLSPHQSLPVVEGEVILDDFDTRITFTTEASWEVQSTPDGPVLVDLEQLGLHGHTRNVGILNVRPWDAETIDEWLERYDEVAVEDRQETQVGGFDAVVYDLDNTSIHWVLFLESQCWNCGGSILLNGDEYTRAWAIDWDAPQPLIVFAFVKDNDIEWLEKVDEIVATMEFG